MFPELVDSHCHLDREPLGADIEAVLSRARDAGVRHCLSIGTDLPSSRANVDLAARHPMLRAAVGVHPYDAQDVTDEMLSAIHSLAQQPTVGAIGEVGLDCYRSQSPLDRQQQALKNFLQMAQQLELPLVLHCREAYDSLLELLGKEGRMPISGVIHCASGPAHFIEEALAIGLHISFAGNVTFPNAQALQNLISLVPDERLLVETDSPFLAPQPVRGKTNEPAYVAHTAAFIAHRRGVSVEKLSALTSRNACKLFGFSENLNDR